MSTTQDKIKVLEEEVLNYFKIGYSLDEVCGHIVPTAIANKISFGEIF